MSERNQAEPADPGLGDPTTTAFWAAARQHRLVVQRCRSCGRHQFYPRPLCLACESLDLEWVEVSGRATVYSMTTIRVPVTPDLTPPYVLALVDLDEGPRLLTNLEGGELRIGDRVELRWRDRGELPPVPIFGPAAGGGA